MEAMGLKGFLRGQQEQNVLLFQKAGYAKKSPESTIAFKPVHQTA
jgi:hypothetical protein